MASVTTEAQVANLALGLIGQRQTIDSLTEDTAEAACANNFFASTRDELLEAWHWRFATKRTVLALTTEERTGWGYAYAAPSDMLAAQQLWNGNREVGSGEMIPFTKELNDAGSGHLILTDQVEAELIYTVRLETVALWTNSFVRAVAAQLAVYMAGMIPVKPELMASLQRSATIALNAAAMRDANETVRDPIADSEFIRER